MFNNFRRGDLVIKIKHGTARVPIGTVFTYDSKSRYNNSFYIKEIRNFQCSARCYEKLR